MAVVTGVDAITVSDVKQYEANCQLLLQQRLSKLRMTVTEQSVTGEAGAIMEQFGTVEAVQRTNRHADTPLVPVPADRRWVHPVDWELADMIDHQDRLRKIIEPDDKYVRVFASSMARRLDDTILEGIYGTNKTGQAGTSNQTFTSANIVTSGGGSSELTVAKLLTLKKLMLNADVDPEAEPIYGIISPEQAMSLLGETKVGSVDYNAVKPLVDGMVSKFMGINFIVSNRIAGAAKYNGTALSLATDIHRAVFYPKSGVGLGMWQDFDAEISKRADKSNNTQIYAKSTFGATRLEEAKVFAIDTDHS